LELCNFRDDGVDVAIRFGLGQWPGLRADLLLREESFPVAAPSLATGGRPLDEPRDLAQHTLLHVSLYPDDWRRWLAMTGYAGLEPAGNLTFDENATALQAAINGLGVALGRHALTDADIAAGRLVDPFRMPLPQAAAFYVVSPLASLEQSKIMAFREWILEQAELPAPPMP
jgi:LysR family transcriptional regulator, glycine cleavage system transcriptional activator